MHRPARNGRACVDGGPPPRLPATGRQGTPPTCRQSAACRRGAGLRQAAGRSQLTAAQLGAGVGAPGGQNRSAHPGGLADRLLRWRLRRTLVAAAVGWHTARGRGARHEAPACPGRPVEDRLCAGMRRCAHGCHWFIQSGREAARVAGTCSAAGNMRCRRPERRRWPDLCRRAPPAGPLMSRQGTCTASSTIGRCRKSWR